MKIDKNKLTQLYNKYPQYRLYNEDAFLAEMVKLKEITLAEMELLKKPSLFSFDFPDSCGLKLEYTSPKRYHKDFPDIELDYKGQIVMEQFEPDRIKTMLENKGYEVKEEKSEYGNSIVAKNKKTNEAIVYRFTDGMMGNYIYIDTSSANRSKTLSINSQTKMLDSYMENEVPDKVTNGIPMMFKPIKYIKYVDNKETFILENDVPKISDEYMNNFIKDIESLNSKNKNTIDECDMLQNILEIPCTFYGALLEQYHKMTGKNLLDKVGEFPILSQTIKTLANSDKINKFTPKELAHAIDKELSKSNPDVSFLMTALTHDLTKLFNSMEEYDKIQQDKKEQFNTFIDKLNLWHDKPEQEYALFQKSDTVKNLIHNIYSSHISSRKKKLLVSDFIQRLALNTGYTYGSIDFDVEHSSLEAQKELLESTDWSEIIDKYYKESYTEDIEHDILANSKDMQKLLVDLQRLQNRGPSIFKEGNVKPNNKIDNEYSQGATGDCWLIAGIVSIMDKTGGKEYLESLLTYDETNKCTTVNLKGVGKSYIVSDIEVEKSNHLADGELDIRKFEIAVDKYMRDCSYEHTPSKDNILMQVDNIGNWDSAAFELLIGKAQQHQCYQKGMYKEFNNQNKIFTFGLAYTGNEEQENKADITIELTDDTFLTRLKRWLTNEEDPTTELKNGLVDEHEYSIVGSDETYVYIKNPWYPDKTMRISIEDFENLDITIGSVDVNFQS